jgi:hypothetical protein
MALGSSCFGLLFLGSGSTFGSTSPPTVLPAILGPGRRLLARPFRETRGHPGFWILPRDSLLTARACEANILGIFCFTFGDGRPMEKAIISDGHSKGSGLKTRVSCHRGQSILLDQ